MSSENLGKRIDKLDERFYDFSFPEGSTKIATECLTPEERHIIAKWDKISEKYKDNVPEPIAHENRELLEAITRILWLRVFDIFKFTMVTMYCKSNFDELIFWKKFFTFLEETGWIIKRNHLEEDKMQELFGNDSKWYSEDDDAIPDSDPRWKQLSDFMKQAEAEHEAELKKKRGEEAKMNAKLFRNISEDDEDE